MSTRKYFLLGGVGSALLFAALLFTFSPMRSGIAYAAPSAVTFAEHNWSCFDAACTKKVDQGDAQPNYECAEFVARSLAFAGYMPGLGATSPVGDYDPYNPHLGNGRVYDLRLITPMTGLYTLADYLLDSGFGQKLKPETLSGAVAGDVVVFEDANHIARHTALIVAVGSDPSATLLDAHNDARWHKSISFFSPSSFPYWYVIHVS